MNAKTIVENVLTPTRTRALWTANYFPALPFTPQHFEVGSLLPAMLYMARWGHRRGKGHFVEAFGGQDAQGKVQPPRLVDVANGLLTRAGNDFDGFADDLGPAMLADLLLSYCLENKQHELGHNEVVQRAFPTHYLASWVDLPETVAHLRGVPELLTTLLAWQDRGEVLVPETGRSRFPVGVGFAENHLLKQFARHMLVHGPAANLGSDHFHEETADDLGVDELLAVRLAQTCGHAPDKLKGKEQAQIANRWPIAKAAAKCLRGDLATFIEVYGTALPRQAFLPMLEAGIGLGMVNLLFSTAVCLSDWERTGGVPRDQKPMPLLVDCSHGLDSKLRNASEAAMSECLARYERLPVLMMLARVLDDRVSHHPKLRNELPPRQPDSTVWFNLLGEIYCERHERAHSIMERLDEDCSRLADDLEKASEALEAVRALRNDQINPALRLAEALVELHGHQQHGGQFLKALDSSLMPNRPNGFAFKRRVSRSEAGTRKAVDLRSIVLSHALLDFLVHRHLRKDGEGKAARPLTLRRFLDILRDHYGLYVDREPPGISVAQDLLRANKQWLERRLRDLGLLVGVNDAESMKQLRARFDVA
jgi:hypothetical protein